MEGFADEPCRRATPAGIREEAAAFVGRGPCCVTLGFALRLRHPEMWLGASWAEQWRRLHVTVLALLYVPPNVDRGGGFIHRKPFFFESGLERVNVIRFFGRESM